MTWAEKKGALHNKTRQWQHIKLKAAVKALKAGTGDEIQLQAQIKWDVNAEHTRERERVTVKRT